MYYHKARLSLRIQLAASINLFFGHDCRWDTSQPKHPSHCQLGKVWFLYRRNTDDNGTHRANCGILTSSSLVLLGFYQQRVYVTPSWGLWKFMIERTNTASLTLTGGKELKESFCPLHKEHFKEHYAARVPQLEMPPKRAYPENYGERRSTNIEEMEHVLKTFKNNKSAGTDKRKTEGLKYNSSNQLIRVLFLLLAVFMLETLKSSRRI